MKGLFREVPGSPTLPAQLETFLSQPAPEVLCGKEGEAESIFPLVY